MQQAFQLGEWVVHPDLNRVRGDGGEERHLEPRVMDLLVYLADHAGEVLPRERILAAVWPDRYVAEEVLTRAVRELRRTLGDDARSPRFVETIHKRGYRLVAEVRREAAAPVAARPPDPGTDSCFLLFGEEVLPLREGATVIGRGTDADVRLVVPRMSRRHARIVVDGGRAVIEDLGSKNGTWVRGARLREPTRLENGDRVLLGSIELVFRDPCTAATETDTG